MDQMTVVCIVTFAIGIAVLEVKFKNQKSVDEKKKQQNTSVFVQHIMYLFKLCVCHFTLQYIISIKAI